MPNLRQTILETLNQRGALPVNEIARAVRHSPIATRYHLTLLIDEGLVETNPPNQHTGVGRPQALYTLADSAHDRLPKQYKWLAMQLLDEMGDALGEKEQRAFLRRVGRRLAAQAPALRSSARIETRLEHTADFLQARGYVAHWEKNANDYALHICNCPYRHVALEHRQICEMDIALVGELVKTPMKLTACLANRQARCSFVIRASELRAKK